MARTRRVENCVRCGEPFHPHNGNTDAKYCSRLCACRDRNTQEHQRKAAAVGGAANGNKLRGTGTKGYVKQGGRHQHRVVMESIIGRSLSSNEIVHHKDEDKHNNSPDNLVVVSRAKHVAHHWRGEPI